MVVPGGEEDIAFDPAPWMNVKRVPHGKNVDQMLDGELEAALYPETLPSIRNGNPKVALLFPEPKKAEIEYYKNGGFFPIMHTVVVKNPNLETASVGRDQFGASFSKGQRDLLRKKQRPAQFRPGLSSGSYEARSGKRSSVPILGPTIWKTIEGPWKRRSATNTSRG